MNGQSQLKLLCRIGAGVRVNSDCPRCDKAGRLDGTEEHLSEGKAEWFMYCCDCNWQWDLLFENPEIINSGRATVGSLNS